MANNRNNPAEREYSTESSEYKRVETDEKSIEKSGKDKIYDWHADIETKRFDVNKTLQSTINISNSLAKELSKSKGIKNLSGKTVRELLPFLRERTEIPEELGRKDLSKLYNSLDKQDIARLTKFADDTCKMFDKYWQNYKEVKGILTDEDIENHISHIWETTKSHKGLLTNFFNTNSKFAIIKKIGNKIYKSGLLEKRGYRTERKVYDEYKRGYRNNNSKHSDRIGTTNSIDYRQKGSEPKTKGFWQDFLSVPEENSDISTESTRRNSGSALVRESSGRNDNRSSRGAGKTDEISIEKSGRDKIYDWHGDIETKRYDVNKTLQSTINISNSLAKELSKSKDINNLISSKDNNLKVDIGIVNDKVKQVAKEVNIKLDGYRHNIDKSALNHFKNEHFGENEKFKKMYH